MAKTAKASTPKSEKGHMLEDVDAKAKKVSSKSSKMSKKKGSKSAKSAKSVSSKAVSSKAAVTRYLRTV